MRGSRGCSSPTASRRSRARRNGGPWQTARKTRQPGPAPPRGGPTCPEPCSRRLPPPPWRHSRPPRRRASRSRSARSTTYKRMAGLCRTLQARGSRLALEEINAEGGVLGRPLEFIFRDDQGEPGEAIKIAEELMTREGTVMLTGSILSNVGLAISSLAARRGIRLPRRRAAGRCGDVEPGQRLDLPAARLDLHAGGDAGRGRGRDGRRDLRDDRAQLRLRQGCGRGLQGGADRAQAGGRVRRRAMARRSSTSTRAPRCRRWSAPSPTRSTT